MTTTIDTSGWIIHDNLNNLETSALNTFAANNSNNYTLIETENNTFAGSGSWTAGGATGNNNSGQWREYRWDCAQIPFIRNLVPTDGQQSLFSYDTLSHGKGARPYQHLTWTHSSGAHIHMTPVIDSVTLRYLNNPSRWGNDYQPRLSADNSEFQENPASTLKILWRFFYSSLTNNLAFPNFNDASPEFDIHIFRADDVTKRLSITDWPISTTGAGSNIVFSTTAPSGSVMRRTGVGTGEMQAHSIFHIPSNTQLTNSQSEWNGLWGNPDLLRPDKLILAIRLHSQTAPYVRVPNVPRIVNLDQILLQQGPYGSGENFSEPVNSTLHLGATVVVNHTEHEEVDHEVSIASGIRLQGMVETTLGTLT